jgi:hypothetical protein
MLELCHDLCKRSDLNVVAYWEQLKKRQEANSKRDTVSKRMKFRLNVDLASFFVPLSTLNLLVLESPQPFWNRQQLPLLPWPGE